MLKNKKLSVLTFLVCFTILGSAQTYSPYSRYGYGVLSDQSVGPARGMGGLSYGLRRTDAANPNNPASYSAVDSLTFIFDIGINYVNGTLSDNNSSMTRSNGGLEYITMLMRLSKKLGLSFGVLPYSSVGYTFGTNAYVGNLQYKSTYDGTGAFSQLYTGLGYEPIKNLSVGFNAAFVFSNINDGRTLLPIVSNVYRQDNRKKLGITAVNLNFGLQYTKQLAKDKNLTLGATFGPGTNSSGRFTENTYLLDPAAQTVISGDTTEVSVQLGLPMTYGFGFTYTQKKLLIGADVSYQEWKKIAYPGELMGDGFGPTNDKRFNNRLKITTGLEYTPDIFSRKFFHRVRYRGGFNYANSYINVMNSDGNIGGYKEYGATLGLGLPMFDNYTGRTSYINLSFEYKNLSPNLPNMIREQYLGVSLSVDLNDLWFLKSKFK